jgi:hypothetical protein
MTDEDMIAKYPHLKTYSGYVGDVERNKNIRAHLKSLGIEAAVKTDHANSVYVNLPFGRNEKDLEATRKATECFKLRSTFELGGDYLSHESTAFTRMYGGVKYLKVTVAGRSRDEEHAKASVEKEARKASEEELASERKKFNQATKSAYLQCALRDSKITAVRQWLAAGADPNATDGWLHSTKKESAVLAVLDAGADVNARNKRGETLLHYWAENQSFCETLVQRGADPRAVSNKGYAPDFDDAQRSKLETMADAWTAEQARLKLEAAVPQVQRDPKAHLLASIPRREPDRERGGMQRL